MNHFINCKTLFVIQNIFLLAELKYNNYPMTGLSSLQAFSIDPSSVQKGERKLEVFWIDRLQVNKHRGLNEDIDFIFFLYYLLCYYFIQH